MGWQEQGRPEHGWSGHGVDSNVGDHYIRGGASHYNLPGNKMANGALFDASAMNAAMLHVPLGTRVHVTSLSASSRSIEVTVTDRGPYVSGRIIDLTPKAFGASFGSTTVGTGQVVVQILDRWGAREVCTSIPGWCAPGIQRPGVRLRSFDPEWRASFFRQDRRHLTGRDSCLDRVGTQVQRVAYCH